MSERPLGVYAVWTLVLLLVIAHQDHWLWNDSTLVWGFVPSGLFFHACLSIAAALTWLLAVKFAWPADLEPDSKTDASANDQQVAS